jgi:outer membrane protein
MRHLKLVLVAMLLWMGATTANAQKTAHINVQKIMVEMPEFKAGQAQLKKLYATYEKEFKEMQQAYQAKVQKYQQESGTVSQQENEKRVKELMGMEKTIAEQQKQIQQEAAKKEASLMKPIQEKLLKAIKDVAAAKGYDYVFDSSGPTSLIVANGPDLYNDVKTKLGF